jgi:hypothetical protein
MPIEGRIEPKGGGPITELNCIADGGFARVDKYLIDSSTVMSLIIESFKHKPGGRVFEAYQSDAIRAQRRSCSLALVAQMGIEIKEIPADGQEVEIEIFDENGQEATLYLSETRVNG